jgi:membrane-associated protease RseP (regulator of RpoE activity)
MAENTATNEPGRNGEPEVQETTSHVTKGSWRRLTIALALIGSLMLSPGRGETVALLALLTLILLHEGGHYAVARVCKMKVEQFFVGFGPVVWSMRRKGIEYGVKAIPLGGYVRIAGMTEEDAGVEDGYQKAGRLRKIAVVAAGPATNLLIALVVAFCTLFMVGLPTASTTVERIDPRLGAAAAGIRPGDTIVAANGKPVESFDDLGEQVQLVGAGRSIEVVIERRGLQYMYPVEILEDAGLARIGLTAETVYVPLSATESMDGSVQTVNGVVVNSLRGIKSLATGLGGLVAGLFGAEVDPQSRPLSPVGAVQIGAEIGGSSLFNALELIVVYSTFLAVFNLLPLLPLDGGRIAVVLYETVASVVRRRKVEVSMRSMAKFSYGFTMLLLGVGVIALILDITQPVLQ